MLELINILSWTLIAASLAALAVLLVKGRLNERSLALGPERDLGLDPIVYKAGALFVLAYVCLQLMLGWSADPASLMLLQVAPMLIVGLFIGLAVRYEAGLCMLGIAPRHPVRDLAWAGLATLVAVGLSFGSGLLIKTISTWLNIEGQDVVHETLRTLKEDFSAQLLITIIISAVLLAPLIEELLFRGVLQTSLLHLMHKRRWPTLLITAAIFSATHWHAVDWQGLLPLFLVGLVFGYVYEKTGSLLACVLTHAGFNAINIAVALAMQQPAAAGS